MNENEVKYTGIQGRKPHTVMLENGELTVVKKMFKIGNGYGLLLPTEWLAALSQQGLLQAADGQFTLWYDNDKLIIEPLKVKVEGRI